MKNTVLNNNSTKTILIVDDSQFSLEAMKGVLDCTEWNLVTADSGAAALEWLMKVPDVSLIILYVQMQDMNGFVLAKHIRENFAMKTVPIIFISGDNVLDEYITCGFSVGTSDFLVKPININVLIQRIELYLKFYHQQHYFKTINKQLLFQYEELLLSMAEAVLICDDEGFIYSTNRAVQRIFGYEANELNGLNIEQLVPENIRNKHITLRKKILQNPNIKCMGESHALKVQRKDGTVFSVEISLSPIWIGEQHFISVLIRDLNELKTYKDKISHQAMHDALTGLPNRTVLYDRILQGILQGQRNGQQLAVIFMGIDRFKVINSSLGPDAGDKLLIMVTERIKSVLRNMDTLVRYEGDEFVLVALLDHINDISIILENLDKENQRMLTINDHDLHVSLSIGVCVANNETRQPDELLKYANAAMNEVKASGGGNFQFCNNEFNQRVEHRLELEMGMVLGLNDDEFILHYQAKFSPENSQISGFEALVRWQHPEKGIISPVEFIPVAEENRFILPLGEWVLQTASEQAMVWHQSGAFNGRIAVNISGVQIISKEFINTLRHQVEHKIIHPHLLELELTETVMLENPKEVANILNELKMMGFTLALDDFGTGYSSLAWLSEFPYDTIKIAQSFVSKALLTDKHRIIIKHTIEMAKQLGLIVVAEGVETQEQLDLLTVMGCDLIQGYFYSKPLEAHKLEQMYHNN